MSTSQTYLVGGAVRDQLLGLPVHERDYVVVGSTPGALVAQGYTQVGKDFPVFLHPQSKQEYALARTERKAGQGYKGFNVYAAPEVTLEEDLFRRDLTINAIAQADDGSLIDPFGGQQDLNAKLIRHVSPAFSEDPLRVLRTARFAAYLHHLGFNIAQETQALLFTLVQSGELNTLVKERIWQETHKALTSQSPWIFFEVLEACGALEQLMSPLAELLKRKPQALNGLQLLCPTNTSVDLRLAGILYQLNKPQIENLAAQIKLPNTHKKLSLAISNHQRALRAYHELDAPQRHHVINSLGLVHQPELLIPIMTLCQAITESKEPLFGWHSPEPYILADLAAINNVNPADLMAQGYSGQQLGNALKQAQIDCLTLIPT